MIAPAVPQAATVPRPAALRDVEPMARLINGYAEQGLMLPKSTHELYRLLREYLVVVGPDDHVVACGGLRIYRPELAEIVGLAVRQQWQGRGLGGTLIDRLVVEAEQFGIPQVFAMTLDERFFQRRGFRSVPREWLPEKLGGDCRGCARQPGCREIAVLRSLRGEPERPAVRGRRLRVLRA